MRSYLFVLRSSFLLVCLCSLILCGCKKDNDDDDTPGPVPEGKYPFSFSLQDNYSRGYAYVILHTLDGSGLISYQKVVGNGTADFGMLDTNRVTVSTVRIDTFRYNGDLIRNMFIATDIASPAGHWVFRGLPGEADQTEANVTLMYPSGQYDDLLLSATQRHGGYTYTGIVPEDHYTRKFSLYNTPVDNTIDFYAAVYSDDQGFCNWLFGYPIQPFVVNDLGLTLDKPLDSKMVACSKPFYRFALDGFSGSLKIDHNLRIFNYYNSESQIPSIEVRYPADMPVTGLKAYINGNEGSSSYYYHTDLGGSLSLPAQISIPTHSISASYDEAKGEVGNIQINGTADQIGANWRFNGISNDYLSWIVYAEKTEVVLKRPFLPPEVRNDIGPVVNMLEIDFVLLTDYDMTGSHADIITRFFIEDVPIVQRFNEGFTYYYRFPDKDGEPVSRKEGFPGSHFSRY